MGARNHFKNEASSKIQTSIGNFLRKVCFGLLSTVVIFFCINSCTGVTAQSSAVTVQSSDVGTNSERWEYKILELNIIYGNNVVNSDTLNNLGKQGWELIFVTVGDQAINKTPTHLFTLKRKLP
jgi:hypothetical protein